MKKNRRTQSKKMNETNDRAGVQIGSEKKWTNNNNRSKKRNAYTHITNDESKRMSEQYDETLWIVAHKLITFGNGSIAI